MLLMHEECSEKSLVFLFCTAGLVGMLVIHPPIFGVYSFSLLLFLFSILFFLLLQEDTRRLAYRKKNIMPFYLLSVLLMIAATPLVAVHLASLPAEWQENAIA
jgi:hypothetical protein